MEDPNLSQSHLLTDEVDVDLDVLRAAMMNWVGCHVDSTNIVSKNNSRRRNRDVKFLEKLPQPAAFGHNMCHGPVLSLSAGAGDCGLSLGCPRDEVVAEVERSSRRWNVESRGHPAQSASEYAVRDLTGPTPI
jgi:hypothetical protein